LPENERKLPAGTFASLKNYMTDKVRRKRIVSVTLLVLCSLFCVHTTFWRHRPRFLALHGLVHSSPVCRCPVQQFICKF